MSTLEKPELYVNPAGTEAASLAAEGKVFKLKLSLPGKNIGGEWLCRLTGAALAYQSYCATYGTPRQFTWHLYKGNYYLQDQDGNWLSWETTADCLYMSYWSNAAAWKIEGQRLIRVSDGAVLSYKQHQKWPLADEKFLMALPPSADALTVEVVDVPPK